MEEKSPTVLEIHFKNSHPVELTDLADMMNAYASEYSSFCKKKNFPTESRLYVSEVKKGSVVIDLVAIGATAVMSVIESANTVAEFADFVKRAFEYLRGRNERRPEEIDSGTYKNFKKIVEPCCKDEKSSFTLSVKDCGSVNVFLNQDCTDCAVVKTAASAKESVEALPSLDHLSKAILYVKQIRDSKDSVGDRGIIPEVDKSPKKLFSIDEKFKEALLESRDNAFDYGYLVDVDVSRLGDKVAAYKIMKFHEKFKIDEIL